MGVVARKERVVEDVRSCVKIWKIGSYCWVRKWELLLGKKEWLKTCIRASKSEKVGVIAG